MADAGQEAETEAGKAAFDLVSSQALSLWEEQGKAPVPPATPPHSTPPLPARYTGIKGAGFI